MSDIVERLRVPVMLHYNAESVNAERREAAAEIERLRTERSAVIDALLPFANAVFNDNGDMTITTCGRKEYLKAYHTIRKLAAHQQKVPSDD